MMFFFFQAEDGIRDTSVTGVQTCALPICSRCRRCSSAGAWSCNGGTQSGATISVPLGGAVTCTLTNDDDSPSLKLVKTEIGRASCRERGENWGVGVSLIKRKVVVGRQSTI